MVIGESEGVIVAFSASDEDRENVVRKVGSEGGMRNVFQCSL